MGFNEGIPRINRGPEEEKTPTPDVSAIKHTLDQLKAKSNQEQSLVIDEEGLRDVLDTLEIQPLEKE